MTSRTIELRSDTFTKPTEAMRRAMYDAEVGDDVWDEDPTVDRLEEAAADLMGKEAAVFVSSGTQGNLIALVSHAAPGHEVIMGDKSHIFTAEAAGAAVVGGLQAHPLPNRDDGRLRPDEVKAALRDASDYHNAPTGVVALEDTHNKCGGAVLGPREVAAVAEVAHEAGVPLHLDGARIFNAAVALGIPARQLTARVDSVTFCLSKGLGAPVGSVLCGSHEFIAAARRWRKRLGGGMRQSGILAAAGLVALENVDRLAEDHANARRLADGLAAIPGIEVEPERVETNIVFFDIAGTGLSPARFVDELASRGVRLASDTTRFRALLSYEVSSEDVDRVLVTVRQAMQPLAVGRS
jgi:threonine aldolase